VKSVADRFKWGEHLMSFAISTVPAIVRQAHLHRVHDESSPPAFDPPNAAETFALELRWYEGRMLPYAEWLMDFAGRHRAEILALAAGSGEPAALVAATKRLIVQRGSLRRAEELHDQIHEIENELWYRGEKGDHDRRRIQQEWTVANACAWRRWRIKEYLFVADRCAEELAATLANPDSCTG
jgi:hypothetical protein